MMCNEYYDHYKRIFIKALIVAFIICFILIVMIYKEQLALYVKDIITLLKNPYIRRSIL